MVDGDLKYNVVRAGSFALVDRDNVIAAWKRCHDAYTFAKEEECVASDYSDVRLYNWMLKANRSTDFYAFFYDLLVLSALCDDVEYVLSVYKLFFDNEAENMRMTALVFCQMT